MKIYFCFFIIFFSQSIIYSQDYELSLQELCSLSSDIVIAKPISSTTFQSENKKHIYTNIKFGVIDKIKGRFTKHDEFEMLVYGGKLNGITQFVVDAPSYKIGEESLLFLKENISRESIRIFFTVTGGIQGKYNIYIDENTGVKHLTKDQAYIPTPNEESDRNIQNILFDQPRLEQMIKLIKTEILR